MWEQRDQYQAELHAVATQHGCTEFAAFDVQNGVDHAWLLCHVRAAEDADGTTPQAALSAFKDIIRRCVTAEKDGAIRIVEEPSPARCRYCLVTLARRADAIVAAAAFIVRCNDDLSAQRMLSDIQTGTQRFHDTPPTV